MKRILLLLLFAGVAHAQEYVIRPQVLSNGQTLTVMRPITNTGTYQYVVSCIGSGNFAVKGRVRFQERTSGWILFDSVYTTSTVRLTYSTTGDSLQRVWLPDDTSSIGYAGSVLMRYSGWYLMLTIEAQPSGNGGMVSLSQATGYQAYTPVAYAGDWIKRADSTQSPPWYVTPTWFWDNMIASSGVTAGALTDSLDNNPRKAPKDTVGDWLRYAGATRTWADGRFLTTYLETDPLATSLAEAVFSDSADANVLRKRAPTGYNLGVLPLWLTQSSDTSTGLWGWWLGNYTWTNLGTYVDEVFQTGYNMAGTTAGVPQFGTSLESKYAIDGAYHSEFHHVFRGTGTAATTRPYSWVGRWVDGRITGMHLSADRLTIYPGGTTCVGNADSGRIYYDLAGGNSYLNFHGNGALRFSPAPTGTFTGSNMIYGYNGSSYAWALATGYAGGNSSVQLGSSGWTSTNLYAGSYSLSLESGGQLRTTAKTWSNDPYDSINVATKNYVETRIVAALTDTLNATVTRGATIKADTASLALLGDKLYPRTAGSGGGSLWDTSAVSIRPKNPMGFDSTDFRVTNTGIVGLKSIYRDSTGVALASGDTVKFFEIERVPPIAPPRMGTPTDFNNKYRHGWIKYRFVLSGDLIRSTTRPYQIYFRSDSGAGCNIVGIEFDAAVTEATQPYFVRQRSLISMNGALAWDVAHATILGAGGSNTPITAAPLGTRSAVRVVIGSTGSVNNDVFDCTVTIYYRQTQGTAESQRPVWMHQ